MEIGSCLSHSRPFPIKYTEPVSEPLKRRMKFRRNFKKFVYGVYFRSLKHILKIHDCDKDLYFMIVIKIKSY